MWGVEGLLERDCLLNMMVVGDSDYEIDAGKKFKANANDFTTKRVLLKLIKFTDDPTPDQLIKQLLILNQRFDTISTNQKSLNITLESKEKIKSQTVSVPKDKKSKKKSSKGKS